MALPTLLLILLWVAAALLAALLLVSAVMWQRRLRTDVPGPPPVPLVGNVLQALNPAAAMRAVKSGYLEYGHTVRFYIGPKLVICLSRPEDLKRVLGDPKITDRDPYISEVISSFMGDGLIASRGEKWKAHRRIIAPTFNAKIMESFLTVFNEGASSLASHLEKTCGLETAIFSHVSKATLDMISQTAMDVGVGLAPREFTQAVVRMGQLIQERVMRPWLLWLEWLFWWTKVSRDSRKVCSVLNAYADSVISRKMAEVEDQNTSYVKSNSEDGDVCVKLKKRLPFINLMIRSKDGMQLSPMDLRSEVCSLMVAGYEATANSLCFTLPLLGLYPEWQQAVHQELDEVFGSEKVEDYHRPVTLADLPKLEVVERVIKESLRLFPVAPLLVRYIPADMHLCTGNYKVPAGSCVMCFNYFTHRQADSFPDPEKFDPNRFLPENSSNQIPYSYVPFGVGL